MITAINVVYVCITKPKQSKYLTNYKFDNWVIKLSCGVVLGSIGKCLEKDFNLFSCLFVVLDLWSNKIMTKDFQTAANKIFLV
jgi:hypothetical protein